LPKVIDLGDAHIQYPPCEDFRDAWRHPSSSYRMVLLQRKWAKDDLL